MRLLRRFAPCNDVQISFGLDESNLYSLNAIRYNTKYDIRYAIYDSIILSNYFIINNLKSSQILIGS